MKIKTLNHFNLNQEVFDRFTGYPYMITYERFVYKAVKTIIEGDKKKLIYRCEPERHNLVITTVGGIVVNVQGIYSMDEVAV